MSVSPPDDYSLAPSGLPVPQIDTDIKGVMMPSLVEPGAISLGL